MKILDLLTDLIQHLEEEQNKSKTFHTVKINGVYVYFTAFEYCCENKCIHFFNDKIMTTTVWNNNLVEYRIVY